MLLIPPSLLLIEILPRKMINVQVAKPLIVQIVKRTFLAPCGKGFCDGGYIPFPNSQCDPGPQLWCLANLI